MSTSQDLVSEFLLAYADTAAEHDRHKLARAPRRNGALARKRAQRDRLLSARQARQYAMTGVRYDA